MTRTHIIFLVFLMPALAHCARTNPRATQFVGQAPDKSNATSTASSTDASVNPQPNTDVVVPTTATSTSTATSQPTGAGSVGGHDPGVAPGSDADDLQPPPSVAPSTSPATTTLTSTGTSTSTQSSTTGQTQPVTPGAGRFRIGGLTVGAPSGMQLIQQADVDGTALVAFGNAERYVAIYARKGSDTTTQGLFVNGSQVTQPETAKKVGSYDWKTIGTRKSLQGVPHAGNYNVFGFLMEKDGTSYFGYSRSSSAQAAQADAEALLALVQ